MRKVGNPKNVGRISIPKQAHPLARLCFALMRETGVSYDLLEHHSGVLRSTTKAWRGGGTYPANSPSLVSIEAVLGVWGWSVIAVPPLESFSPETQAALEDISLDFRSDAEAIGAALLIAAQAAEKAHPRSDGETPAPLVQYGTPYWLPEAA